MKQKNEAEMTTPLQAMRDLLAEDERYKIEAYQFIREALQYAHENLTLDVEEEVKLGEKPFPRHVTGQQLCEACRLYAIEQYGYLAMIVLANWGIRSTCDLGLLV
jgi:uncharacterized repeat protein (TIGR04138 family)